jgi:hypothetical protein
VERHDFLASVGGRSGRGFGRGLDQMGEDLPDVALDGVELGPPQILDLLGHVLQVKRIRKPSASGKIPQGSGLLCSDQARKSSS